MSEEKKNKSLSKKFIFGFILFMIGIFGNIFFTILVDPYATGSIEIKIALFSLDFIFSMVSIGGAVLIIIEFRKMY